MESLEQRLAIPYIKLKIHLFFPEDSILPGDKVSALRGGMGEMLLRQNCINDRDCRNCDFMEPCIVYKTLYTQMKRKPAFMQGMDSIGYLIECENYQTEFQAGEGFFFYLVLFGNNIVYFGQYLQAFYQLGVAGIGGHMAQYHITDIKNVEGASLLKKNQVFMSDYRPETVYDHVLRRKKELDAKGCRKELIFHTPLTLKYQGEFIDEFRSEAVFQALFRRIMMLDYFVEIYLEQPRQISYPLIRRQESAMRTIRRYSSTQDAEISLRGIVGKILFDDIPQEYIPYILAGELLHIGKNTSFGFGRYTFR